MCIFVTRPFKWGICDGVVVKLLVCGASGSGFNSLSPLYDFKDWLSPAFKLQCGLDLGTVQNTINSNITGKCNIEFCNIFIRENCNMTSKITEYCNIRKHYTTYFSKSEVEVKGHVCLPHLFQVINQEHFAPEASNIVRKPGFFFCSVAHFMADIRLCSQ